MELMAFEDPRRNLQSHATSMRKYALDGICHKTHNLPMAWDVEFTDELGAWWEALSEEEQVSIDASVRLLEARGPQLGYPHTCGIETSSHSHMRELRVQHEGRPYRVLYAFDPRRTAILLIGGDKTGNDRWYEEYVPRADKLYDAYLDELRKEGLIDGKKDR
ncbi:hypothetical protein J2W96_006187 [Variovorax guangxiensis]|nr:hypothetical protein [Variovorax guangxiensis]